MNHPGMFLILVGLILVAAGLIWMFLPYIPWLGRLPGDIAVERGGFRFYFPLASCVLLSLIISGVWWLIRWFSR
ncbi:MAG TPA: DUF2905 domain-containing protein [Thermoguttaceae bacterium]